MECRVVFLSGIVGDHGGSQGCKVGQLGGDLRKICRYPERIAFFIAAVLIKEDNVTGLAPSKDFPDSHILRLGNTMVPAQRYVLHPIDLSAVKVLYGRVINDNSLVFHGELRDITQIVSARIIRQFIGNWFTDF